ncbi:hypothetical protein BU24DRAFT_425614 [Aaosphaeria arxii CBS 175.79]|uniref:RING-type domain-containing protein n=1 Tax=Aaosphaeria arxii CBS 175.79 TaxID=1450172 RepID=A0A6A5XJY2_9PLEO|nr:uncharacterized protein BU24DRAFT_425614 [Aaosphaeria arxii CBS 175.79]KAF2013050.1 hypothetical protein BU24DRAFT_425614 [Aaosphaeria arxii CBS 175.79]
MSSVFASIVRPGRPPRANSNHTNASADILQPPSPETVAADADEPDLRELNASLQALIEIFPDIQPEVFREMLQSFSEDSRLQVVTETLMKHRKKWVRGRYRMPAEQEEQQEAAHQYKYRDADQQKDTRGIPLALEDTFRSKAYREAAKEALYHEFKGLRHSTVKAVLAEYNWGYSQARPTLLTLSSSSWRSSITNFFMRRKAPSAKDHPHVVWTTLDAKNGQQKIPLLVKTRSRELDHELYQTLIAPELEKQRIEQISLDRELALKLNEETAEELEEMYDCECCFIPNTLDQMSTCDMDGHYICFRCIRFAINAALYDQGWARNMNTELGTLRCIAPITDGTDDCTGCVPLSFVRRALLEETDGQDTLHKLDERFSSEALLKSQLPLLHCPFCSYAEVDELALPGNNLLRGLRLKRRPLLLAVPLLELFCFEIFRVVLQVLILLVSLIVLMNYLLPTPFSFLRPLKSSIRQIHLRRRGLRFQCLSPQCGRYSCVSCSAPWHDPHVCYSSQLESLRATLDRATTDAIKRTCPKCNLGFVKLEGCNKLVCLCGYVMCYVCREGLGSQGYTHFCQHFRDTPGRPCAECNKCDLYRVEDDDLAVARAKEVAAAAWWEKQGNTTGKDLQREVAGELKVYQDRSTKSILRFWRNWEVWLEKLIEALVV